ncbi:hypothetical protein BDN72DRAFT_863789 [Pluteus cervinus]|uniref:Uncharacterized protein n=1 Tax=Pluteus cervinus TaxID=181527 RepID=A0ACD3A5S4_9AGAR|nr:hypothetical protein BDN72DRAFT_863789 [Pluteus cervinus]
MPPAVSTPRFTKYELSSFSRSFTDWFLGNASAMLVTATAICSNVKAKTTEDVTAPGQDTLPVKATRERRPSAKLRQIAEDQLPVKTVTGTSSTVKKATTSLVLKALENPLVAPPGALSDDDELPEPGNMLKKVFQQSEVNKDQDSDDEPIASPVKIARSNAALKSADNKKTYTNDVDKSNDDDVVVVVSSSNKVDNKEPTKDGIALKMAAKFRAVLDEASPASPVPSDDVQSIQDDDDTVAVGGPVTDKEYQHPELYDLYVDLPYIRRLAQVLSYKLGDEDEVPSGTIPMDRLFRRVEMKDLTCIFNGLTFRRYGRFVNMARAKLNIYRVEIIKSPTTGNKIFKAMLSNREEHPIFWMIGGVVDSFLSCTTTHFNKPIHGLKIGTFAQEGRRDFSAWGYVLGFRSTTGPVDTDGFITFLTRTAPKQVEGNSMSTPSSPSKASRSFKVTYSPRVASKVSSPSKKAPKDYPFERYFEERVPVYNGIASQGHPFNFEDSEFDKLTKRALWESKTGDGEVPEGSIVAVGYTLHVWGDEKQYISPNLVSVIMLHEVLLRVIVTLLPRLWALMNGVRIHTRLNVIPPKFVSTLCSPLPS